MNILPNSPTARNFTHNLLSRKFNGLSITPPDHTHDVVEGKIIVFELPCIRRESERVYLLLIWSL